MRLLIVNLSTCLWNTSERVKVSKKILPTAADTDPKLRLSCLSHSAWFEPRSQPAKNAEQKLISILQQPNVVRAGTDW